MAKQSCGILSAGPGAWAFEALAQQLSAALWVEVSEAPCDFNYLLFADETTAVALGGKTFIPVAGMQLAADKRRLAEVFAAGGVPTPTTRLVDSLEEAQRLRASAPDREWCVKFPTSCGASGHRFLDHALVLPSDWPYPLVVQEFIRMEHPEVYRLYAADGDVFGWVARRFPEGTTPSPWVAHARGARYELTGDPPRAALDAARIALGVTGLLDSFGCVDLVRTAQGEWVVLEVGTDGLFNHVDRDLGQPALEREIQERVAQAFWRHVGPPPWGTSAWSPRPGVMA